jgi:hypothetical protein
MTKTFAATQTQASRAIEAAASKAVTAGMILASERGEVVKAALSALRMSGSAYICGETITLTQRAQDASRAASIRNMSEANFDRFAYGM